MTVEPRRQGRPRNPAARDAVVRATTELLRERGYRGVTIEGVAARAGVAKRTIYRWWPTKGALVADAYADSIRREHPEPDTGSARGDLTISISRQPQPQPDGRPSGTVVGTFASAGARRRARRWTWSTWRRTP